MSCISEKGLFTKHEEKRGRAKNEEAFWDIEGYWELLPRLQA
jgi:hypothetical protein